MHRAVSHHAEPLAISVSRRCLHLASRNARRQACVPRKFMVPYTFDLATKQRHTVITIIPLSVMSSFGKLQEVSKAFIY